MSFFSSLFAGHREGTLAAAKTPLELTTAAVALVSNPEAIDLILDKVRSITVGLQPGQELSPADEAALLGVYLQIEAYLTTKEPIRKFTKQELRSRLQEQLRRKLASYEAKG